MQGCLHAALRYSACCTLAFSPSATDGPSPMQLTGACRPCGSSSPCSCCPCLVRFLGVCLTVQKPTVRTYRIEKTLPQCSDLTFYTAFAASPHTLHHTVIIRLERPAATFFCSRHRPILTHPSLSNLPTRLSSLSNVSRQPFLCWIP